MQATDVVFFACTGLALCGWGCLVLAPRAPLTGWLARTHALPAAIAGVYVGLIVVNIARGGGSDGHFFSLEGVARLFDDRVVLLAGWIHYLAFDLFIGAWELRDAQRRQIAHGWLVPCLLLTLWVGPAGLLAWLVVRRARARA